jgi:methylmalonyl-CoA/ethylmalonyl-CoA epimerase
MTLGRLHHYGFIVADMEAGLRAFEKSMAAVWDGKVFHDPNQKVNVAFLAAGSGSALIELVQPATPDSPVRRFLTEKGGGLHHVCYEVADVERDLEVLRSQGNFVMKRPKPAVAFDGRLIAWILTPDRLLIELLQEP